MEFFTRETPNITRPYLWEGVLVPEVRTPPPKEPALGPLLRWATWCFRANREERFGDTELLTPNKSPEVITLMGECDLESTTRRASIRLVEQLL